MIPEALPGGPGGPRRLRLDRAGGRARHPADGQGAGRAPGLRARPRPRPRDHRRPAGLRRRRLHATRRSRRRCPSTWASATAQKQPDVALVVVIDKSGSMDACHCNSFGDGMGGGAGIAGVKKVDIGKEAILRAASALTGQDELGVVAFDQEAHWVVKTAPLGGMHGPPGRDRRRSSPNGQTNIYAGLDQAVQSLEDATATRRHIILLTDGWSSSGQYDEILSKMKAAGITLSTVGAGGGANPFLEQLAQGRRRALLRRRQPGLDPGHLPQGDAAGLGPADRRGDVLPDPDLLVADHARHRRRPAVPAGLQRDDGQGGGARPSWSPRATIRSSPSGSTAWAGRSRGRRTRPGAGPRAGSAGTASRSSSARWSAGRSRARRAAASRPRSSIAAGGRTCGWRASTPTARRATSTRPGSPWWGLTSSRRRWTSPRSRRACTRRRSRRSRAARTRCA